MELDPADYLTNVFYFIDEESEAQRDDSILNTVHSTAVLPTGLAS